MNSLPTASLLACALLACATTALAQHAHDHGPKEGHGSESKATASQHDERPRFGGRVFEAKEHHFEVLNTDTSFLIVPRDHFEKYGPKQAATAKIVLQVPGAAPSNHSLEWRSATDTFPAHFRAGGGNLDLQASGAKALVVMKKVKGVGRRGLTFWVKPLAMLAAESPHDKNHQGHQQEEDSKENGHDHTGSQRGHSH